MNLSRSVTGLIAVAVLTLPFEISRVVPMDHQGRFFVLGVGKRPCSDYIKFREKKLDLTPEQYEIAQHALEHWAAGFLTAHNYYESDTYNAQGNNTATQTQQQVETYCRQNPNNYFAEAVIARALTLNPSRVVSERATRQK